MGRPRGLAHVGADFQVFIRVTLELGAAALAAEVVGLAAQGEAAQGAGGVDHGAADGVDVAQVWGSVLCCDCGRFTAAICLAPAERNQPGDGGQGYLVRSDRAYVWARGGAY